MSPRPNNPYRIQPLHELTQRLLATPAPQRLDQVRRAERLHDEIDPHAEYPIDYLVYRMTSARVSSPQTLVAPGEAILPDLRLMIDALSRSVDLTPQDDEGIETIEALATRLNVSTKTINRWRAAGLRWRWVVPQRGARKQVAFTREAVRRFVERNAQRVEKASRFTQMEAEERRRLIDRARRIARARPGVSLNQVAAHLSKKTGRALETIRQLLETHDQERPDHRIFEEGGPLDAHQRRVIARAYRMGVSVSKIATRFGRTRSTIYRVINERRAATARRIPLHFVESPIYARADADEVLLRGDLELFPPGHRRVMSSVPVDDLPEPLRRLYRQPVIEDERQRSLFVRFNYLKFKAAKIRDGLDKYEPRAADLEAFEACVKQAGRIRDALVRANLPVVLSVARRHLIGQADKSLPRLLMLLELGVPVLIEAVDTYHAARSQTFPSFLTNRLLQQFLVATAGGAQAKALRRIPAEQFVRKMVDQASESGVALTLEPEGEETEE